MLIHIHRSAGWLHARRLDTGTNVPEVAEVEINPADLDVVPRSILLELGRGEYPSKVYRLGYNGSYEPSGNGIYSSFGAADCESDADPITPADVGAALIAARNKIHAAANEAAAARALREEAERQKSAALALCQPELDALRDKIKNLDQWGEGMKADRRTLAEFLAEVPDDALRGTLKRLASSPAAVATLRSKVEDASPVTIFEDDESDDESDDE